MTNTTTQATHTPGPWGLDGNSDEGFAIVASNGRGGDAILTTEIWDIADARLIAAAPAMLRELRLAYESLGWQSLADVIEQATGVAP